MLKLIGAFISLVFGIIFISIIGFIGLSVLTMVFDMCFEVMFGHRLVTPFLQGLGI